MDPQYLLITPFPHHIQMLGDRQISNKESEQPTDKLEHNKLVTQLFFASRAPINIIEVCSHGKKWHLICV
jgi:hypothetical protein